jgi:flagellar hook-length control protein FliK
MKVRIQSGATSMHLELNPKELGVIEVEMISSSQGLSVTFFAEQAGTGRLLETQINQLRQSLIDSGVQLTDLNINQHSQYRQEGGFSNQNSDFARDFPNSTPHVETNNKEYPGIGQIPGQSSEIDYRI